MLMFTFVLSLIGLLLGICIGNHYGARQICIDLCELFPDVVTNLIDNTKRAYRSEEIELRNYLLRAKSKFDEED